jgi:hypothetical protein
VDTAAGIADTMVAMVLIFAGAMKVGNLAIFGQQIAMYRIIPERFAGVVGRLLPPLEIAIGVSILFFPRLAAAGVVLFATFAAALGVNVLRGRTELHCGCFGVTSKHTISPSHIAVNLGLTSLAAFTFIKRHAPSFIAFQIGVSALLLVALFVAWRTIKPIAEAAEEASQR